MRQVKCLSFVLIFLLGCFSIGLATIAHQTLSWEAPVSYTDGTPVTAADIKEYRVYVAEKTGGYLPPVITSIVTGTTEVPLLQVVPASRKDGRYFFVVTTVDKVGVESDWSNEVSAIKRGELFTPHGLPGAPKNAVFILKIVIQP